MASGSHFARRLTDCEASETPDYVMGFLFTVGAGLATMLGCLAIPCLRVGDPQKLTSVALGFAAGVMMDISFNNILGDEAQDYFEEHFVPCGHEDEAEADRPIWVTVNIRAYFMLGVVATICFGKLAAWVQHKGAREPTVGRSLTSTPDATEAAPPQEDVRSRDDPPPQAPDEERASSLERVSLVAFLALTMHNLPEGLATFFSGGAGSFIVPIAIALHNIPEGMAVAVPLYQATGSVRKALWNTFLAGVAQPIGAAIGWLLVAAFEVEDVPAYLYGILYAATAGVMVCVSIQELLPHAFAGASAELVSISVYAGFVAMQVTVIVLEAAGA